MKNNLFKIMILALVELLCSTNAVYAKTLSLPPEVKTIMVKFGLAMIVIVLFSVLISVGLSLYNKFFVSSQVKDYKLNKDSLRTPMDKEEALMVYITKNRLK